jgi:hypothetical protein
VHPLIDGTLTLDMTISTGLDCQSGPALGLAVLQGISTGVAH